MWSVERDKKLPVGDTALFLTIPPPPNPVMFMNLPFFFFLLKFLFKWISTLNVGLELRAPISRVTRSSDSAGQESLEFFFLPFLKFYLFS